MRRRTITITGLSLAIALPVAAQAGSPRDRATGGGQFAVSLQGAGNTIAFTAQNSGTSGDAATGQVQYIERVNGQDKLHGTVSCLRVSGNTAKLAGTGADGRHFQLYVVDNGQGANADNDMISFQFADQASCDFNPGSDVPELARGNAQVYDAPAATTAHTRTRHARHR